MIALRIFPPPLAVLAYHGRELQVEDMPVLTADRGGKSKRQADVRALTDLIRTMAPSNAVIERVGAWSAAGAGPARSPCRPSLWSAPERKRRSPL